jgi:hypothetical protein
MSRAYCPSFKLEVTRDSQVTGTCVGRVRMRHRPRTWERNTAQRVICARSRYCLCNRDRKNWPFATGILLTEPARDANCDPRRSTPKIGIGSGHRRVPNTRQYDVELKILDKISHGGASTADKSTTGRFPYQQGTFLRGLWVNIRVNRLIRSRSLRKFVRVSVENTRSLEFLVNFEK